MIISCSQHKGDASYELANAAIDSVIVQNIKVRHDGIKHGESMVPYFRAVVKRYVFAHIYLSALNQMEKGEVRNKVIRRYNKEVGVDPEDFFPADDMDSARQSIFLMNQ